ncbi:sulfite exporter TauE/SafE family protein [Pelagibaculum spongiae]|uniref:Probable membrane transporter protein n=1 Tax=Pelagibaculum spongiae TaxID=2080658 RepID=A0A2V1GWD7_9GAMM|nr:sulfite exporter TauE/SafE family protein [Pelagibaculum spongiae]PVZ68977.1 hypothetical protein DC094_12085 [Pelagibaculum spongiae]
MPDLLFPTPLTGWVIVLLVLIAAMTSTMTAAVGAGGGLLMLVVLIWFLPAEVVIPVHAIVQLGSNSGRLYLQRKHLDIQLIGRFSSGALIGTALGGLLLIAFALEDQSWLISFFVLWLLWLPSKYRFPLKIPFSMVGSSTSFLSVFVGATGPLVGAFISRMSLKKAQTSALFAGAMSVQHGLKLILFGLVGFAFQQWIGLCLLMISSGFIGTQLGLKLQNRLPEQRFKQIFRWMLTLLALEMLISHFW